MTHILLGFYDFMHASYTFAEAELVKAALQYNQI